MNSLQPVTFYVVRHGQTLWNVAHKIQGHTDNPLTPVGEEQAKNLRTELHDIHFDAIFSSDFLRAKQTAEIIAKERELAVITKEALRERNMGIYEGRDISTLASYTQLYQWFSKGNSAKNRKVGVENDESVMSRLLTFFREIAVAYPGKTMLLVTHGSLMKALLVHLGFAHHDQLVHGAVKNTAYIELQSDGIDFSLVKVKDIAVKT